MKKKKYPPEFQSLGSENESVPSEALSKEELALLRGGENRSKLPPHDTSDRAHLLRFVRKNKPVAIAALIIALAFVAGAILGIYFLIDHINSKPNTSDFTVILGEEKPYTVPYEEAVRDGVLFIDMKRVAAYAGMTVSGSDKRIAFAAQGQTYLRFEQDSEYAVINGDRVVILAEPLDGGDKKSVKAIVNENECLIPFSFFKQTVSVGMLFRLDRETNTIGIKRAVYYPDGDEDNPKAADILFHSANFAVIPPETEPPKYEYSYVIDMKPYLESITKTNLFLANKQNPMSETFVPADLTKITCATASNRELYLCQDAAIALEALMEEMLACGITDAYITSAYRAYDRQYELYFTTYYNQEKAKHPEWTDEQIFAEVSTYSAYPGTSEHQTGLCVDFMTETMSELDNSFAATDAAAWLRENAYKFGFSLRYPEDKVAITQYSYESWHYRFVGREAASDIHFSGVCLEEYLSGIAESSTS